MAYLVRFKSDDELESAEREIWAKYRAEKLKSHGLQGLGIDRTVDGRPVAPITTRLVETFTRDGVPGGLMLLESHEIRFLPGAAEGNVMSYGPEQLEARYADIHADIAPVVRSIEPVPDKAVVALVVAPEADPALEEKNAS